MRRNAGITLDTSVVPMRLTERAPSGLTAERMRSVWERCSKLMEGRGVAAMERASRALAEMPLRADEFVLLPMNIVLWLYAVGCSPDEEERLFRGIANTAMLAHAADDTDDSVPKALWPVSATVKKRMSGSADAYADRKNRSFNELQALMAAFCCAVRGRKGMSPLERTVDMLGSAAPMLLDGIAGGVDFRAMYGEKNPAMSVMLAAACHAMPARLLVRALLFRASGSGRYVRTATASLSDLLARVLTYFELTRYWEMRDSLDAGIVFSGMWLW